MKSGHAVFEVCLKVLPGEGSLLDRTYSELGSVEVFDHVDEVVVLDERWGDQNVHELELLRGGYGIRLYAGNLPRTLEIGFVIALL